jgi:hypothetical protein
MTLAPGARLGPYEILPLAMVLTSGMAGLVLQGGGAVHHVFGSPRFSADLDFAQQPDLDEVRLSAGLADAATLAQAAWGACSVEAVTTKGRLHRQKLRVSLDGGVSHVLAAVLDEVAAERLRGELRDVLPRPDLERFDPAVAVAMVSAFYLELSA